MSLTLSLCRLSRILLLRHTLHLLWSHTLNILRHVHRHHLWTTRRTLLRHKLLWTLLTLLGLLLLLILLSLTLRTLWNTVLVNLWSHHKLRWKLLVHITRRNHLLLHIWWHLLRIDWNVHLLWMDLAHLLLLWVYLWLWQWLLLWLLSYLTLLWNWLILRWQLIYFR